MNVPFETFDGWISLNPPGPQGETWPKLVNYFDVIAQSDPPRCVLKFGSCEFSPSGGNATLGIMKRFSTNLGVFYWGVLIEGRYIHWQALQGRVSLVPSQPRQWSEVGLSVEDLTSHSASISSATLLEISNFR